MSGQKHNPDYEHISAVVAGIRRRTAAGDAKMCTAADVFLRQAGSRREASGFSAVRAAAEGGA